MKHRQDFSAEDQAFIIEMIGKYPARVIAEHIGSTINSVTKFCVMNNISMIDKRHEQGMPISHLADVWNCNHHQITHFIKMHGLPTVSNDTISNRKFVIIDTKKLPRWLASGYAVSLAIRPTIPTYVHMVNTARETIYNQMIPSKYLTRIIFAHDQTVFNWMRNGKLPPHDFKYAGVLYHNRVSLSLFLIERFGKTVANRVLELKWSIYDRTSSNS